MCQVRVCAFFLFLSFSLIPFDLRLSSLWQLVFYMPRMQNKSSKRAWEYCAFCCCWTKRPQVLITPRHQMVQPRLMCLLTFCRFAIGVGISNYGMDTSVSVTVLLGLVVARIHQCLPHSLAFDADSTLSHFQSSSSPHTLHCTSSIIRSHISSHRTKKTCPQRSTADSALDYNA